MSSSSKQINPSTYGGFGRDVGPLGGLGEKEFSSRCPPDVQPNTRIIAVCGISDIQGDANPYLDGWFFSDFFLFHYLLQDSETFTSGNQVWLTCANPRELFHKYGAYLHGPRNGDRRVVLDEERLRRMEAAGNVRVVHPKDLLERFLSTLKKEIEIANQKNQPVLVLVFGHGDEGTHGIAIGATTPTNAPRLTRPTFGFALKKGVEVNLVTTSCYSGGWVVTPKLKTPDIRGAKPMFNITGMTAAGVYTESLAWATSLSQGRRSGGSMFATAIMNSLMITSEISPNDKPESIFAALEQRVTTTDDGEAVEDSPTFVELSKSVYKAMTELGDGSHLYESSHISFAAQDDKWDAEWRTRSGFPLKRYREMWERLPVEPAGIQVYEEKSLSNRVGSGRSNNLKISKIRSKAMDFMLSTPGDLASGGNSVHKRFIQLIEGHDFSDDELDELNKVLDYRMDLLRTASEYADFMDLRFMPATHYDTVYWLRQMKTQSQSINQKDAKDAKDALFRFNHIRNYIIDSRLFDLPLRDQGLAYSKPKEYLAIALAVSGLSQVDVEARINRLLIVKSVAAFTTSQTEKGKAILNHSTVVEKKRTFRSSISRFGERLRSLSPRDVETHECKECVD